MPVMLQKSIRSSYKCLAVAEAGVLVGPVLQQLVDVAMGGDEAVRPERDAAFELPGFELVGRRLEDRSTA